MICYVFLGEDFCACTHMLQVNLGDVVELVLIDEGYAYDVMHPFHLHGHSFYVVAMERHAEIPDHIGPAPGKYLLVYFFHAGVFEEGFDVGMSVIMAFF